MFWAANREEAGQVLHGYQSAWLPASLLQPDRQGSLGDALFAASRHWSVSLHVSKGLAGAPADAIAAARDGDESSRAGCICTGHQRRRGAASLSGIPGYEPDLSAARLHAEAIDRAMTEMRSLLPTGGSYVAESNFFEPAWRNPSGVRTTRGCLP